LRKPSWLKVPFPTSSNFFYVSALLKKDNLHTICQSAKCPNTSECWAHKTATFLILGDICTRNCAFCAVKTGHPDPVDKDECHRIAQAVASLELRYVVLTSVTRDDLPDGGALAFTEVIRAIKASNPEIQVEALVPDFQGRLDALQLVIDAEPAVLNHNLEVPERLYTKINRKKENYQRSLSILAQAKKRGAVTKSGLMVGLGETEKDILRTFEDLRSVQCDLLTIGQYLKPTPENLDVEEYITPSQFSRLKHKALHMGFKAVEAAPLVRSSYNAHRIFTMIQKGAT